MTKFVKILLCLSTLGLVAQNNFNQFDDKGERHGPWRKFLITPMLLDIQELLTMVKR